MDVLDAEKPRAGCSEDLVEPSGGPLRGELAHPGVIESGETMKVLTEHADLVGTIDAARQRSRVAAEGLDEQRGANLFEKAQKIICPTRGRGGEPRIGLFEGGLFGEESIDLGGGDTTDRRLANECVECLAEANARRLHLQDRRRSHGLLELAVLEERCQVGGG